MNKRYILDSEVKKWNNIFEKLHINISTYVNRHGDLCFNEFSGSTEMRTYKEIRNPSSRYFFYNFSFSVVEKRRDDLLKLLKLFSNIGLAGLGIENKVSLVDEISKCEVMPHEISGINLVRYSYTFTDILTAIQVVAIVEDAVKFIQMLYEYEEDGGVEICTMKYPIGSVVSMTGDRDIDYMVDDYIYDRPNSLGYYSAAHDEEYRIHYRIICIDGSLKSPIIRYGDSKIVGESEICPSRTNNLNIILN